MSLTIAIEDPDQPELRAMLTAADAYYATLYPAESNHLLDIASLQDPATAFFVARWDGEALGYGAILDRAADNPGDGYAEVKRMYVDPKARGRKLGRHLLQALEDHAADLGHSVIRLEAGTKQPEALGLYRTQGFGERGRFGDYPEDPYSVFMEKRLKTG